MENKILLGNSLEILKTFPSESVEICITSPPYKDEDNFDILEQFEIFKQIYRVLRPNSLFFLNFGHLANFKERPFLVLLKALEAGFNLNDTIIWQKAQYKPIQGFKRLNNLSEFIFLLYKGKMPKLDRMSIGIPYEDESNAKRYGKNKNLKCAGNIWRIPYETIQSRKEKLHNDRFPIELPLKCLKLSGLKEGIVLDPFSGSGTVGVAAKQLGLNYLLIEKQEKHYKTIEERLK